MDTRSPRGELKGKGTVGKRPYPIMEFFDCAHLPPHLREVSQPFCDLALQMHKLPQGAEVAAGLRKLLEAKDCFVRAALSKKEDSE